MSDERSRRRSLDSLKKEANGWLAALRAHADDARARLERASCRPEERIARPKDLHLAVALLQRCRSFAKSTLERSEGLRTTKTATAFSPQEDTEDTEECGKAKQSSVTTVSSVVNNRTFKYCIVRRTQHGATTSHEEPMKPAFFIVVATSLLLPLAGCASIGKVIAAIPTTSAPLTNGYRIVAPATVADVTPAQMLDRLSRADVVFFGEQHDDPETHRAEAELLEAIGRSGRPVILSLEMFERDVQPVVDDYVAGRMSESDFRAQSRPWDRYATDYRRLIELAKEHRWRVVAANVPRSLASAIGRKGLAALDTLALKERSYAARDNACPRDDYHARFMESMQSHSPGSGPAPQPGDSLPTAMAERFYLAQCVKDETMAESIVSARVAAPREAIVVHFDGAFHSDYSQGTVARVKRRQPGWTLAVVSAVPVADPAAAPIVTQSGKADYVIFTRRPAARRP